MREKIERREEDHDKRERKRDKEKFGGEENEER